MHNKVSVVLIGLGSIYGIISSLYVVFWYFLSGPSRTSQIVFGDIALMTQAMSNLALVSAVVGIALSVFFLWSMLRESHVPMWQIALVSGVGIMSTMGIGALLVFVGHIYRSGK